MYDDDCQEVLYFGIYRYRREGTPPVVINYGVFCPRKQEQELQRSIGRMVNYL